MKNSDMKYIQIMEMVHEGIWLIDNEFKIVHANEHIARMLGYSKKEITGKSVFDFLDEKGRTLLKKKSKNSYKIIAKQQECKLFHKDGYNLMVNLSASPFFGKEGSCEGAFVMVTDISEQKSIEEIKKLKAQIHHTQKLETLGILAGGIAHDFNNLLVTILGNADLALLKLFPKSPLFNHINNIKTTAMRASGLTNQMLAYSGKGRFIIEPIDLNMLVEEMAGLLKVSISKNVTLKFSFAENLPSIEADAAQMRQVIMNLITNASEAIGEKSGIVTIKTGLKKKEIDKDSLKNKYVFIEITDTGCGMDEKTKEKIFDPFFTTKLTGRGLGLRVVHEIVLGHHGTIEIHSEPEKGTTFKVMLPSSGKLLKLKKQSYKTIDKAYTGGITILIVDDEEDVREVTKTMLETMNFKVYTASNGHEGIELFRRNDRKIDCILIDLTMPTMSGKEVFKEMRRISLKVPIIISSGYSEHDVKQRFTKMNVTGFIHKPYQMKTLIDKISIVMRSKR